VQHRRPKTPTELCRCDKRNSLYLRGAGPAGPLPSDFTAASALLRALPSRRCGGEIMAKKRAPSRQSRRGSPNVISDYDPIAEFEREMEGRPRPGSGKVISDYDPIAAFEREPGGRLSTPQRLSRKEPTPTSVGSVSEIPNFVSNYIRDNAMTASQSGCVAAWKKKHGSHRRRDLVTEWKIQAEPLGLLRKRGQWGQIAKR